MLKLIYTEMGLHLEWLSDSLEALIARRVTLAIRTGVAMHIEPSSATFLLPADLPELADLATALAHTQTDCIQLQSVDADFVEVSLEGVWLAATTTAQEGFFVSSIDDLALGTEVGTLEALVYQLWQATETEASYLG